MRDKKGGNKQNHHENRGGGSGEHNTYNETQLGGQEGFQLYVDESIECGIKRSHARVLSLGNVLQTQKMSTSREKNVPTVYLFYRSSDMYII